MLIRIGLALAVAFVFLWLARTAPAFQTVDTKCNGHYEDEPIDPPPWPKMKCKTISCSNPCPEDPTEHPLGGGVILYYCQCDEEGEPTCCHTVQRKVDGEFEEPTWAGACRASGTCSPTPCTGTNFKGYTCGGE